MGLFSGGAGACGEELCKTKSREHTTLKMQFIIPFPPGQGMDCPENFHLVLWFANFTLLSSLAQ
jgi:hypothetical protein